MTGSDLIVQILIDSDVTVCFGYPGGAAMPLYDALYKKRDKLKHIRTAHEQGASHAADGYARVSGKLGVCIATSGPGSTNLVTGIATALSDSSHVLFITANVNASEIGSDSFQEADIAGITNPVCKYNWVVRDPYRLASTVKKAISLACKGRPGPVLLDIPHDILSYQFPKDYTPDDTGDDLQEARSPEVPEVEDDTVSKIYTLLKNAERPVIIAGGGAVRSGAYEDLSLFAHNTGIPVASTLMATGILPYNDPLNLGMLGVYGDPDAVDYVDKADVVLALGMRFSNRTHGSVSAGKTVIHVDSDSSELNKNVEATVPVNGDAKAVLASLCGRFDEDPSKEEGFGRKYRKKLARDPGDTGADRPGKYLFSEAKDKIVSDAFSMIKEKLGDVFVVTDVGLHQMAAARLYPFERPGRLITSGGFGTMGFGLGASVGASFACAELTDKKTNTVLVSGDGSFRMSLVELAAVRENRIKMLILVLNNNVLGMVREMQKEFYGRRYIATESHLSMPDFRIIAKAYGLSGFTARDLKEFEKALDSYIIGSKPALIDLRL
ncbi:MAG: thiamine pyrophosphate-binding protein [Clostridia bacterium]|nr:thiamine pyrophosphate-binding protein [Clostridia bacterium]